MTFSQRSSRAQNSLKRAVGALLGADESWLRGYEAERLLWTMLFESESLVGLLHDDAELGDLRKFTDDLARALRHRQLGLKMANTEGRTPEEAEAFLSKAQEFSNE